MTSFWGPSFNNFNSRTASHFEGGRKAQCAKFVVTSHTSRLCMLLCFLYCQSGSKKSYQGISHVFPTIVENLSLNSITLIFTLSLLHQGACDVSHQANLSQTPEKIETLNITKHTAQKKNTFPKCHPTTRAPQVANLKSKPICFFSSLSFSRAFVAQVRFP